VNLDFLFYADRAGDQGSGDDAAESAHGECAVNGKAEVARGVLFGHGCGELAKLFAQFGESGAGDGADGDNRRIFQKRTADKFVHFETHQLEDIPVDEVGLGEDDDSSADTEQAADIEVLARLRLDGFVGGDDEQHQIDAADAGQHIFYEPFVSGYVYETGAQISSQVEMRESEVN